MASDCSIVRPRALAVWLPCAAYLLLQAAPAAAEPSAAERETARGLMQEGDQLRSAGDMRGALARYQSAHAIMHVPTTGLDVARTQAQLGLLVEARGVAVEVSNSPAEPNEPRVFAEARKAATELAAQLESRVPSVKTLVTPPDVPYTLTIDGVKLPDAAREVAFRTNPGMHIISVEAPGRASQTRQVTLADGQATSLSIALPPAELSGPAATTAIAPVATAGMQPAAAPNVAMHADDDPARGGRIRSIIGFSVGGVALVIGSVAGIMSASKTSDLKKQCPNDQCDPSHESELSSSKTLATVANITIPLGIVGIGYGLYELLTLPSTPREQARASGVRFEFTGTGAVMKGTL
jgi:hypothetical protein